MAKSDYIVILIKSYKGLELVSSLQTHARNVCHKFLTKFHFDSTLDSKEINISISYIM